MLQMRSSTSTQDSSSCFKLWPFPGSSPSSLLFFAPQPISLPRTTSAHGLGFEETNVVSYLG